MARAYAAEELSWFAPALFTARLVVTANLPALAAIDDGMRVYFNTRHVADLLAQEEEQAGFGKRTGGCLCCDHDACSRRRPGHCLSCD